MISVLFYNKVFVFNRSSCTLKKKVVVTDRLVVSITGYFGCLMFSGVSATLQWKYVEKKFLLSLGLCVKSWDLTISMPEISNNEKH